MSAHTAHAGEATHAGNPPRIYLLVLLALLILTAVTVGVSYIDFGDGNVIVALIVATIKASLVGLFFMHLLHDKKINAVIIIFAFVFLGLLLMTCFLDKDSRDTYIPANAKPPAGGMPEKKEMPKEGASQGRIVQKQ